MNIFGANQRSIWVDVATAFAIGLVGLLLVELGLRRQVGASGPLLDLLAPAFIGLTSGFVATRGISVGGLAAGIILAFQITLVAGGGGVADIVRIALTATAAAVGFAIASTVRQQDMAVRAFQPSPADLAKLATQLDGDLRGLDPTAPGTFERASALLRQAGEQTMFMGWGGAAPDPVRRAELLRIQGELIEVARLAALAAGATRVTVSSTAQGLDIQAIWGEPPTVDTSLPSQPGPYEQ